MAVTAQRRLQTTDTRRFGSGRDPYAIPDLTEIQTKSYARFLQYETAVEKHKDEGLEAVLREIFPLKAMTRNCSFSTCATSWASPATSPMNAGNYV
jgi:DNA-directed RNA polymerase subunit beta